MTGTHGRMANEAWESLLTAHVVVLKKLAAAKIWSELSMREYDVLYTLSKYDGPIRLGELNRNVLLSQPAMSRLVERLAARGLLERTGDPADGRGLRLALTAAGRERQRSIGGRHAVDVTSVLSAELTGEEMRQLQTICRKLAGQDRSMTEPTGIGSPPQDKKNEASTK